MPTRTIVILLLVGACIALVVLINARTPATPPETTHTLASTSSIPITTVPNDTAVRVPILVYHGVRDTSPDEAADVREYNVSPRELRRQLAYLQTEGFTPIHFSALDAYFDHSTPLPDKPVILTFDDGWHSQYQHALPLLQEFDAVATFFLFPNGIGSTNFMTWEEVRELVAAGMEIGSHSRSHLYMTTQGTTTLPREIAGSKSWLEDELGISVTTFSYPFGLYNEHISALLEESGYTTARTLHKSTWQDRAHRLELNSYIITNNFANFTYILDIVETNGPPLSI